jgi:hypothetical protein
VKFYSLHLLDKFPNAIGTVKARNQSLCVMLDMSSLASIFKNIIIPKFENK